MGDRILEQVWEENEEFCLGYIHFEADMQHQVETVSQQLEYDTKAQGGRYLQSFRWQRTCLPVQETQVQSLGQKDPLEEEMATHSSILAWRIPWTEEPGEYSPWGRKESDMTEHLTHTHTHTHTKPQEQAGDRARWGPSIESGFIHIGRHMQSELRKGQGTNQKNSIM